MEKFPLYRPFKMKILNAFSQLKIAWKRRERWLLALYGLFILLGFVVLTLMFIKLWHEAFPRGTDTMNQPPQTYGDQSPIIETGGGDVTIEDSFNKTFTQSSLDPAVKWRQKKHDNESIMFEIDVRTRMAIDRDRILFERLWGCTPPKNTGDSFRFDEHTGRPYVYFFESTCDAKFVNAEDVHFSVKPMEE